MPAHRRAVPPRVVTSVEMFGDVTICQKDACRVVQIMKRWWLYDDGSYVLSVHRADDPLCGGTLAGNDEGGHDILEARTDDMWDLADPVAVR